MASVLDVAAYILSKKHPLSPMKLQKLCYYAQAWSLVWDDRALFHEPIEAWANGPVVMELYKRHRQEWSLDKDSIPGDLSALDAEARETIDVVLDAYGDRTAQWLSDLTHEELPWREARKGLAPGESSRNQISLGTMAEYYSSLK